MEDTSFVKGTTKVCGIIGNPVEHSISPVLQNTLAKLTNTDLVYVPFKVNNEDIIEAIKGAYALNIFGLNVTVPHKSAVIDTLKDIDPLAKSINAVNTLVRIEGGYKGYNTDILGLKRELEDENISITDKEVILLGAGGAARAIAFLCASLKAKKVFILNRTLEKAMDIKNAVNDYYNSEICVAMKMEDADKLEKDSYVAIQTTSVGLYPNVEDVCISDDAFYKKIEAGVDIIYNPANTKFMQLVEKNGGKAVNGLKMLLYQGVCAYELWNNISVTKEQAMLVYDAMKKELNID